VLSEHETRHVVILPNGLLARLVAPANLNGVGAAVLISAARRRMAKRRDRARNRFELHFHVDARDRADKRARIGMCRKAKQFANGCRLHQLTRMHDGDPLAGLRDDPQIVRNQEDRCARSVAEVAEQIEDMRGGRYVKARGRLVGDEKLWRGGKRHRDHDALAHPARKLMRVLRNTRRAMQMVYQDPAAALNPRFSARRTIEEPLRLHFKMTAAERRERLDAVIADVGLGTDLVERYPHELSNGQRQRVNIARAVAAHPSLVVLDEPTSALDVSLRSRIILLLEALQKRLGLSFLFISHDIATVKYLAHRVAVMYLGVIVEEADSASLFAAPRHPYTRALLSSVPVPDPDFRHERLVLNGEIPSPTKAFVGCRLRSRCPLAEAVCTEPVPRREVAPGHHVLCHLA
jgi:oligopeptide/dipeptide ABC transporter ATP-binding protein